MIKIREIETGKILERHIIDAKECIGTGRYEYVGKNPKGQPAVTPEALAKAEGRKAPASEEENDEDEGTEEFDVSSVKSMNTKELEDIVSSKELAIENFDKMNLKEKRAAVFEALSETDEEEDEGDE